MMYSLETFFTRDPNEFLHPPEKHRFLSMEVEGGFLVAKYYADMDDGRISNVVIYLNDHGQEVIRTVRLSEPIQQPHYGPILKPKPLAWHEKVWLYFGVHFLRRH